MMPHRVHQVIPVVIVNDMAKDYSIDCCGILTPSDIMAKLSSLFNVSQTTYLSLINKAMIQDIYGKDGCAFEDLNDLNYLAVLCHMMAIYMEEFEEINGRQPTWVELNTAYNIECLITSFQRKNIDIRPMLEAVGAWPKNAEYDGIGYMKIEGVTSPINRVNNQ